MRSHVFGDSPGGWLYVSDGWGVAFSAVALHQLDAATGAERGKFRTRHQSVGCVVADGTDLWVVADRRLFRLGADDLALREQWEKNLVSYASQCLPLGDGRLLVANWLRPTVGLFDAATGRTARLRAGDQPVLAGADGEAHVFSAVAPAHWVLDRAAERLVRRPAPPAPVHRAVAGVGLWAVAGGELDTDRQGSSPIVTRRPSGYLRELTGAGREVRLAAAGERLFADPARGALWVVVGDGRDRLQLVRTGDAAVEATFGAPAGTRFVHVAPALGLAVSAPLDATDGRTPLTAHELPG